MLYRFCLLSTAVCFVAGMAGCDDTPVTNSPPVLSSENGHDHGHGDHEHADTFAGALEELTEMNETMAAGFAGDGDAEAAHDVLHDVKHVLELLSKFSDESHLSDDDKKTIDTQIAVLHDAFNAVDAKLHNLPDAKDYKDVAEDITAALAAIEETAGELLEEGHDHEGHDEHGDHGDHGDHDEDGDHDEHGDDHKDGDHAADGDKGAEAKEADAADKPAAEDEKE